MSCQLEVWFCSVCYVLILPLEFRRYAHSTCHRCVMMGTMIRWRKLGSTVYPTFITECRVLMLSTVAPATPIHDAPEGPVRSQAGRWRSPRWYLGIHRLLPSIILAPLGSKRILEVKWTRTNFRHGSLQDGPQPMAPLHDNDCSFEAESLFYIEC